MMSHLNCTNGAKISIKQIPHQLIIIFTLITWTAQGQRNIALTAFHRKLKFEVFFW